MPDREQLYGIAGRAAGEAALTHGRDGGRTRSATDAFVLSRIARAVVDAVLAAQASDPWNEDRPDLTRVGVQAAARKLYEVQSRDCGDSAPPWDEYQFEYEEDAVQILRAYVAADREPKGENNA